MRVIIVSRGVYFCTYYGYQNVDLNIPKGLGLSEVNLYVKNYVTNYLDGFYYHEGVQGTEKILPVPALP